METPLALGPTGEEGGGRWVNREVVQETQGGEEEKEDRRREMYLRVGDSIMNVCMYVYLTV